MSIRGKSTFSVPFRHLIISIIVALVVAALVFFIWFPGPLVDFAGGQKILWILVGVDVVCGPLLTLLLYRPAKSRLALIIDLGMIAAIQLAALGYGLHTLAQARPLAFVFEVDRFRMVTYADIQEDDRKHLPYWFAPWSLIRARTLGLSPAQSSDERLTIINDSLHGIEAGQRPKHWGDYSASISKVLTRAKPITVLREKYPQHDPLINKAIDTALRDIDAGEVSDGNSLAWIPLVSRNSLEWVVLLDPKSGRIRGYIPLDGF